MKWTTATSLVLALGVLGFVTKKIYAPDHAPTREVVENIRANLNDPGLDYRRVLRRLDRALAGPEAAADDDLAIEILTLRSEVYSLVGAYTDARADLERIQGVYSVTDPQLEMTAAKLQAREGQVEEAWQRIGRLLAREPALGDAWLLRGRLERERAQVHENDALVRCDVALVKKEAEQAAELVRELSARDVEDPVRSRLSAALRNIFLPRHETELYEVLEQIEESSRLNGEARHSYSLAIQNGVDPQAVRAFLDLLVQGGRSELAVEFGLVAISLEALHHDGEVLESLLVALRRLGQDRRALLLLEDWPWRETTTDLTFNRAACRLFYDLQAWKELSGPTGQMKALGGPLDRSYAHFYQGLMHHHRALATNDADKHQKAIETLNDFLDGQPLPPVPQAEGVAFLALAASHRALEQERLERQSLMGAIEVAPKLSGDAYLRLVELQRNTTNLGFRIPESNWTRGMALLPRRTDELFPTWEALGVASLAADELEFKDLLTRLRQTDQAAPTRRVGPFTLHRVAREHLKSGDLPAALSVARSLYEEYPGLLPALDTLIDVLLARGSRLQAATRILERMRLVGANERSRAYLAQVGLSAFNAKQRLELVRIDSLGLGRQLVAEYHLERNHPELALRALRVVEGAEEAPEIDLLRARALLELDKGELAAESAARALKVERLRHAALESLVRARLLGEDDGALARVIDGLLAEEELDPQLAQRIVDRLIAGGRPELAGRMLARLDSKPATRGGDVLVRMALAGALAGDSAGAAEALERAEAFLGDGRVELTRLFLTLDGRDWLTLPKHVRALELGGFEPTALQSAVLALLSEDLDAGLAEAQAGLELNPRSAEWTLVLAAAQVLRDDELELPSYFGAQAVVEARRFLRGDGEEQRDPREALGLLLAVEQEGWGLWVLPRLMRANDEGGGALWPLYLASRAEAKLGQHQHSAANVERLTTNFPGFGPGWDKLEQARRRENDGDPHDPKVLLVREARLRALGAEHMGTPGQLAMDNATARVAAGELGEAILDLTRYVDRAETNDRELAEVRAFLAHLQRERGDYAQAAENYLAAIQRNPRVGAAYVPALLSTLTRSMRATVPRRSRLEAGQVSEHLEALAERLPNDPLVALANVRHELSRDVRNLSLAVNRANGALESLRQRTPGSTLEQLRPGASAAWAAFLRELSPQAAVDILTEDLERAPGNVTLWIELARARESLGDLDGAQGMLQTALDLSDDPDAHQEMARLIARRGGDAREVERHLTRADAAQGRQSSYRTQFIRARTDLQRMSKRSEKIVDRLADLWDVREEFADEVSPLELGLTYASALLQRLEKNDAKILNKLVRTMEPYAFGDPYAIDMLEAYGGVTRVLRVEVEDAQEAAAEAAANAAEEAGEDALDDEPSAEDGAGKGRKKRDKDKPRKRDQAERPSADDGDE